MDLIVETDCGHDPDDFFTLCYLAAAGVDIRCITVVPGDLDQLAIVRLFCQEVGLKIPIGVSKISNKYSSGGVHHELLDKYGRSRAGTSDGPGKNLIKATLKQFPDSEVLVLGPPSNIGCFLEENLTAKIRRLTMQGGFLGYNIFEPTVRLPQFEGKVSIPTFNMNGDINGTKAILAADIGERRFVGKNVCHTVLYDRDIFLGHKRPAKTRAGDLFLEAMGMLLERHSSKKFHDPVAAVCHLEPQIGTWVRGKVHKVAFGGWGTVADSQGDAILADLDRDAFWLKIWEL